MADDDWLFGANKVDEKLVIGEPEEAGRHGSPTPRSHDTAKAGSNPATAPAESGATQTQIQAAALAAARQVARSMTGAVPQESPAAAPPSSTSSTTPLDGHDVTPAGHAAAPPASPTQQANDTVRYPDGSATAPQSIPPPAQHLHDSATPASPAAAPPQSPQTVDDFDPWADDAQDVDDSWTVGDGDGPSSAPRGDMAATAPQSQTSMPAQRHPSAPPRNTPSTGERMQPASDDDWFSGGDAPQPQTSKASMIHTSTGRQGVPATTQHAPDNDDWFTGDTTTPQDADTGMQASSPASPPQSHASDPGDDDWFTGGTPPQSGASIAHASTDAAPPESRNADDWFADDRMPTATTQGIGADAAPQSHPSVTPQDASSTAPMSQSTASDDDWFAEGQMQAAPTMPLQRPASTPQQREDSMVKQSQNSPVDMRKTPHAGLTSADGQSPAPQEAAGSGRSTPPESQNADDWFGDASTPQADGWTTPTQNMAGTPEPDDPWADPAPTGEWQQATQPIQAPTIPLQRPQPASYAPTGVQPDAEPDITEGDNDGRNFWKPFLVVVACVLTLGLIGFGGYYGYNVYRHNMEVHAQQEASQQALRELDRSKASYEADRKQARTLVAKMRNGIVKDDPDVAKQAEALDRLASLGMPRTKKTIGEADTTLNKQYGIASETYQSKVKAKCDTVAKALAGLASQSDQLASAPDSADKTTMQSTAKKWRGKTVSEDSYADAVKAQTDLQNAVNAVQAAKAQADAAAQQAQQQAEAQAQAQAQAQQQQQAQKKSTTTRRRSSSSGSTTKRYSPGGSTRRQQSTPQQTTAPQPAPQPAQPSTPSGEGGVNLG